MAKAHTTIRIGAAHYDLRTTVGDQTAVINIAEELRGLNHFERERTLTALGRTLCDLHGIKEREEPKETGAEKKAKRKQYVRKAKPPATMRDLPNYAPPAQMEM